jgi:hypothetical protein
MGQHDKNNKALINATREVILHNFRCSRKYYTEETKDVITSCKSKKGRKYNGQNNKDNDCGYSVYAFWLSCSQRLLNYLAFKYFDFECIW